MGADYQFHTEWRVPGTISEVAAVLTDPDSLTRWWPSVYLAVTPVSAGGHDGVGRSVRLLTRGRLPYRLRWTLTITETLSASGFALAATGDLHGAGRWHFAQDGPEAVIGYDWQVRAAKPLLRRLSWLLRPVFEANHHWAMAQGERSLALELRRRRATTPAERAAVPPPPRGRGTRGHTGIP